jgi:dihydropteroate synthase
MSHQLLSQHTIDALPRPLLMGVLNVTPDSFSDGGQFLAVEEAVAQASRLLAHGADWLDIGGESTGPGSGEVSLTEELRRVLPVVERVRAAHPQVWISIDTWKAEVARQCLALGAKVINDVTALRRDPDMAQVLAEANAPVVLMYAKEANARTTNQARRYEDVIATIWNFFEERIGWAEAQGVRREQLILDPGMGAFVSADPRYSFEIVRRLPELKALGLPLLLGPSRKSFLAGVSAGRTLPPSERLIPGLGVAAIAAWQGMDILRTHDVAEGRLLLDTVRALRG